MKLGIAKRFACEVEVFDGDKLIDKYIAMENDLVTKNPLGHRRIKDIEIKKSQKQKEQWRSYVLNKLDDQQNISEIVKKYPYKEDKDNA